MKVITQRKYQRNRKRSVVCYIALCMFIFWYWNSIPPVLFDESYSTALYGQNNQLLGARIAEDEQWRFAKLDSVPVKFRKCIVEFEDQDFDAHFGVSPRGVLRAIVQNVTSQKRVSGASTITMQLVRIMRKSPERTYIEKIAEMFRATRIEITYSKEEIMSMYASHAPFGGNVVGLSAASWRYYGCPPHQLSWAESATLAVLPNAPGLIYPGRNKQQLYEKRNRLLKRLLEKGDIDLFTYELAILEPVPDKPKKMPNAAPHLMNECIANSFKGKTIKTTIDAQLQSKTNGILSRHLSEYRSNEIQNGAIVIVSVKTGEVLSYVGNDISLKDQHSGHVNCINGKRSSGSVLKPLLYCQSMSDGLITPKTLLMDVPSNFAGFSPKNFSGNYDGLVPANVALCKSLNVPMAYLLRKYGQSKFHSDLKSFGFTSLTRPASHYGLSLILGGAEITLFDLAKVYSNMAQTLIDGSPENIHFLQTPPVQLEPQMNRASIYETFEAMTEVSRPDVNNHWKNFASSQKIAWKTGTSFGFRDAWAVGITKDYVVAVWVGNADGEGRPGLTGIEAAAPILFDVFDVLPYSTEWFERPWEEYEEAEICEISGAKASRFCTEIRTEKLPVYTLKSSPCKYHKRVHLNKSETKLVESKCYPVEEIVSKNWFYVPPKILSYYQLNHPEYIPLPTLLEGCDDNENLKVNIIYPQNGQHIFLPKNFEQKRQNLIVEAVSNGGEQLYWSLDGMYIGETELIHQMDLELKDGEHEITATDIHGYSKSVKFKIESL